MRRCEQSQTVKVEADTRNFLPKRESCHLQTTPPAAKHVIHHQGENKDETPFLQASSMSMSMAATDLGETSEEADISILRTKGKMGLGECRVH